MLNRLTEILWPKQLISDESAIWIVDCFSWALQNFDADEFYQHSTLILPNNQFFPGVVDNIEAKAENIFKHSLKYAGLEHWPFIIDHSHQLNTASSHYLSPKDLGKIARNSKIEFPLISTIEEIKINYNPQQTTKPEDLSANFGHLFAQHLLVSSKQLPPGGEDYLLEAGEVLAVFMGFGVMLANSAYTFRGGCGSCFNPAANRKSNLTEYEVVFALALFCQLKRVDKKDATQYLKKHLRPVFSIAVRQLAAMDLNSFVAK